MEGEIEKRRRRKRKAESGEDEVGKRKSEIGKKTQKPKVGTARLLE